MSKKTFQFYKGQTMREQDFKNYLIENTSLKGRPLGNCISRCKRVERHLGNLDEWYHKDFLQQVFNSLHDTSTVIHINGDIKSGMSTLRTALKHYKKFCEVMPN